MPLDFTMDKYRLLLYALDGYKIYTVRRYLEEKPSEGFVILRHDVDRIPMNAQKMADLERELGIQSTYYFRYTRGTFRKDIIKTISSMGHEIGYHYETLSKTNGDYEKAIKLFQLELSEFRKICNVRTISMHGKPLSNQINDMIWKYRNFNEFDLLGDSNLSISNLPYFTDAGRTWDNSNNLRDYLKTPTLKAFNIKMTNDLINLFIQRSYPSFYINVHPERWVTNRSEWIISCSLDTMFNLGKKTIKFLR